MSRLSSRDAGPSTERSTGLGIPSSETRSQAHHTPTASASSSTYPSWLPSRPAGPQPPASALASYKLPKGNEPTMEELLRAEELQVEAARAERRRDEALAQLEGGGGGGGVGGGKGKERQAAPRNVQVVGAGPGSTSPTRLSFAPSLAPPIPIELQDPSLPLGLPLGLPVPAPVSRTIPSPQPAYLAAPSDVSGAPSWITPRPRPRFKHPNFRPQLLRDPTTLAKVHYYCLPVLVFGHLVLQIFFDINALMILVLAARYPDADAPGVPGSGRNWALATAAYSVCIALQLLVVFILYEVIYSFYRRWRVKRPLIVPIYTSRAASALLSLTSFTHFSFIHQIRRSGFRSRSARCPGSAADGMAETCYLYAQNGWTVATLLPRAALCLGLLMAFWNVRPGGQVFGASATTMGRDGLFFAEGQGNLTRYGRGVLIANAAWTMWRVLVLLASWIGLWIFSGQVFAGICGPRTRWEEDVPSYGGEKEALSGYDGERELDRLVWGWRERMRERVREAWEFCLVDQRAAGSTRRVSRKTARSSGNTNGHEVLSREREGEKPPIVISVRSPGGRTSVAAPAPPPSAARSSGLQASLARRGILTSDLFASPGQSPALTGSGEATITMPTPVVSGHPLPTLPFPIPEFAPAPPATAPFSTPPPPLRMGDDPDRNDAELAARVQRILNEWVDPNEVYSEYDPDRPSDEFDDEEEEEGNADDDDEFEELAQRRATVVDEPTGASFPSEASMSSLGQPIGSERYPFEYRAPRAGGSRSGSNTGRTGHSHSNSSNSKPSARVGSALSERPSLPPPSPPSSRFVPAFPPPPAQSPRRRQRAGTAPSSGSSPPSVASVFAGPARMRTSSAPREPSTAIEPGASLRGRPPSVGTNPSSEEGDRSDDGEREDNVGLLSRSRDASPQPHPQSSLGRLRQRAGSSGSSLSPRTSGSHSRRRVQGPGATPHSGSASQYSDARSQVPSSGEEEQPPVDRTFGHGQPMPLLPAESPTTTIYARRSAPGSLRPPVRRGSASNISTSDRTDRTVSNRPGLSTASQSFVTALPDPSDEESDVGPDAETWGVRVGRGWPAEAGPSTRLNPM